MGSEVNIWIEEMNDKVNILIKEMQKYPNLAEAHYGLGLLLQNLGRYKEAEIEYRKAIEIDPNDNYAHRYLGTLLSYLERYKEAKRIFYQGLYIPNTNKNNSERVWREDVFHILLYNLHKKIEKDESCKKNALHYEAILKKY